MKKNIFLIYILAIIITFTSCSKIDTIEIETTVEGSSQSDSSWTSPSDSSSNSETAPTISDGTSTTDSGISTPEHTSTTHQVNSPNPIVSNNNSSNTTTTIGSISDETSSNNTESSSTTTDKPNETTTNKTNNNTETSQTTEKPPTEVDPPISGNSYNALNFKDHRGVWISFLELDKILTNKSKSEFTNYITAYFENIKNSKFNTVYVQVRPYGDAIYKSDYFDTSYLITGKTGGSMKYDPLEIMVDIAHKNGLSIHAWINPYRVGKTNSNGPALMDDKFAIKKWFDGKNSTYKEYITSVNSDSSYLLNPGQPAVIDLIVNGAKEIVSKYKVDGIQIDDYFYTSDTVSGGANANFDAQTYKKYNTNNLSLAKWRIQNVNTLVKKMYSGIKSVNKSVEFGISPAGNISNNYGYLSADVKTWCSSAGYIDYIVPQIYYPYKYYGNKVNYKNYTTALKEWNDIVTRSDVKLIIGLGIYKIDESIGSTEDKDWVSKDIIFRQVKDAYALTKVDGVSLYRYDFAYKPSSKSATYVNSNLESILKFFKSNN